MLPHITAPTLVVWGERDGLFPAALADSVVALVPGARKLLVPDASHFVHIDQPEVLAAGLADFFA